MGSRMDQAVAITLETLGPLLAKVAEVHGRQDPRLVTVALEFTGLRARLEAGAPGLAAADGELERFAALTDGFAPPEHACRSYRRALADLEWLRWRVAEERAQCPEPPRPRRSPPAASAAPPAARAPSRRAHPTTTPPRSAAPTPPPSRGTERDDEHDLA